MGSGWLQTHIKTAFKQKCFSGKRVAKCKTFRAKLLVRKTERKGETLAFPAAVLGIPKDGEAHVCAVEP